jgi:hypothetical protein
MAAKPPPDLDEIKRQHRQLGALRYRDPNHVQDVAEIRISETGEGARQQRTLARGTMNLTRRSTKR